MGKLGDRHNYHGSNVKTLFTVMASLYSKEKFSQCYVFRVSKELLEGVVKTRGKHSIFSFHTKWKELGCCYDMHKNNINTIVRQISPKNEIKVATMLSRMQDNLLK